MGEEAILVTAIEMAQHVDVDAVDIERAEDKLRMLRSMTEEQRAMKAARELELARKKTAFFHVKKDDVAKLKELIDEVGEDVPWYEWRDTLGRTIWRCSQDLRAFRVQEFLKQLGVSDQQIKAKARPQTSTEVLQQMQHLKLWRQQQEQNQQRQQQQSEQQEESLQAQADADQPTENAFVATDSTKVGPPLVSEIIGRESAQSTPVMRENSVAVVKAKALRAVAQDDVVALAEIIENIPVDVWSKWENKAGKDLVTLSQERGSVSAYSQLAKALGIVKEVKRETFEEREAVWVFIRGDVQPKRATVLSDTPEEADMIPIEYWDGDEPASMVDRCSVRKISS